MGSYLSYYNLHQLDLVGLHKSIPLGEQLKYKLADVNIHIHNIVSDL